MPNEVTEDDAVATINTIVMGAFIDNLPREAHPFIEQAAKIAANSLRDASIAWALDLIASQARTAIEGTPNAE